MNQGPGSGEPSDPGRLAPEDANYLHSPPRRNRSRAKPNLTDQLRSDLLRSGVAGRRSKVERSRGRSGSRRRKGVVWKKLLWVKQSYPDNYTDGQTFLHDLTINPRLQPYDFLPLVADSTVIVQHVCSVIIFVCCFTGIFQERVSPISIVGWGSLGTLLGWVLWDWWAGFKVGDSEHLGDILGASPDSLPPLAPNMNQGLGIAPSTTGAYLRQQNSTVVPSVPTSQLPTAVTSLNGVQTSAITSEPPISTTAFSTRNQQRLATLKSAILIYCALLGLSPILKSLTKSITSDSIWAMSTWLILINVFFFDYGGGVGVKFPASLSTNAALMASTVLASRLPSTTHVFSLTLFSIEVFGLFPAFRRHLRHVSWRGHLLLTVILVLAASGGVGLTISPGSLNSCIIGMVLGTLVTALAMGGCSWWLIGLQKYKNEIHGPWDPARPVIKMRWE
ncbi:MAG: hypothetical protein M1829_003879 [Trizodia sp. TS-e1964]|nr:MAG: hypothetical protein M1829_003879 [Trizodia sp. TS-e1964]